MTFQDNYRAKKGSGDLDNLFGRAPNPCNADDDYVDPNKYHTESVLGELEWPGSLGDEEEEITGP